MYTGVEDNVGVLRFGSGPYTVDVYDVSEGTHAVAEIPSNPARGALRMKGGLLKAFILTGINTVVEVDVIANTRTTIVGTSFAPGPSNDPPGMGIIDWHVNAAATSAQAFSRTGKRYVINLDTGTVTTNTLPIAGIGTTKYVTRAIYSASADRYAILVLGPGDLETLPITIHLFDSAWTQEGTIPLPAGAWDAMFSPTGNEIVVLDAEDKVSRYSVPGGVLEGSRTIAGIGQYKGTMPRIVAAE
jgi:hypothetical protein